MKETMWFDVSFVIKIHCGNLNKWNACLWMQNHLTYRHQLIIRRVDSGSAFDQFISAVEASVRSLGQQPHQIPILALTCLKGKPQLAFVCQKSHNQQQDFWSLLRSPPASTQHPSADRDSRAMAHVWKAARIIPIPASTGNNARNISIA